MIRTVIVDSDAKRMDEMAARLRQDGCEAIVIDTPTALPEWFRRNVADVLVLSVNAVDIGIFAPTRELKEVRPDMSIVMLAEPCSQLIDLHGLLQSIDAYLAKPVDMSLLSAVIRGLRAPTEHTPGREWKLRRSRMELIAPDGRPIPLSQSEWRLLNAAAVAQGKPVSRRTLIEALGHEYWQYDERRLEALISRLRRKLVARACSSFAVRGLRGQGYLFAANLAQWPD